MTNKKNSNKEIILNENLDVALGQRYLEYALSTITDRALPDSRDGLKPVHRRILYAMRQLKLAPSGSFRKCAKIVGEVMGNFHPHGDKAIYDSLVRMAQTFTTRYPLIEGQGNFGNIDGDNAAAQRYTEARLSEISMIMLDGLDESAVDFKDNNCETVILAFIIPEMSALIQTTSPSITPFLPSTTFPSVVTDPFNVPSTLISPLEFMSPVIVVPPPIILTATVFSDFFIISFLLLNILFWVLSCYKTNKN